ncbi:histone deacetylase 11 isoform X1 [Halyomorpha halys]|uniref:histone deacetylase 11 isoform X1 n=1 Tax=Halyomorpha halys TaxID=286706 RepID=UPI0006D4D2CA|nr:histone deacetylase 11-like isoform X2 [Halyomorpha halys]XP_014288121.1 histone deacetylase 11-like isoform X2 [Halyomorpha halys]XP_014288122.1 histone deacetylase 11-like isoform X2 [Halyomorpha halys]XP_014288123.1 histone deacetylase 11-like isoform X2 [Halyomorpha halys]XP_014288124.1 histone deacetylase 11-like isoform X2 [Halyomorpha halys]
MILIDSTSIRSFYWCDSESCEEQQKWPIVYSKSYNVHFCGVEKLHPFDAAKWENIYKRLKELISLNDNEIFLPEEATIQDLLLVHTQRYLNSLKWGWNVASIAEIPLLAFLPNIFIQRCYLRPMRYQTRGSMMAGQLAVDRGWAINIGGGFHHCGKDRGGGFCPYADITLMIESLFKSRPNEVKKIMIVDLDAHQGNGYERDFLGNSKVFIMDVYNSRIYPQDTEAKKAIHCKIELHYYTQDAEYLDKVESCLERSLRAFHPDLLVYNAGTDILEGDTLGRLSITPQGVIRRDELVFMKARERRVPIVMLTSGGYTKQSALVIAESIANLHGLGLISKN